MYHKLLISFIAMALGSQTMKSFAQEEPWNPTAHYLKRMDFFRQHTAINPTKIVMLGNSLTELGGDWNRRLDVENVVNYGIVGDEAKGMEARLNEILAYQPKALIMMCGINDLSHQLTADQVAEKVMKLIDKIRKQAPDMPLYIESLLPINESFNRWKRLENRTDDVAKINQRLKRYCVDHHLLFIDIYPHMVMDGTQILKKEYSVDGLHLSEEGYQVWSSVLKKYVNKINQK